MFLFSAGKLLILFCRIWVFLQSGIIKGFVLCKRFIWTIIVHKINLNDK